MLKIKLSFASQICLCINLFMAFCSYAQQYEPSYKALHSKNYIQDKNFYLFTLWNGLPEIRKALFSNASLQTITQKRNQMLNYMAECKDSIACNARLFLWTDTEIKAVGTALRELTTSNMALKNMVKNHLRASGYYIIYNTKDDGLLLEQAWKDAAIGINHIIQTYALGQKPLYPDIDSVSYSIRSKKYAQLIGVTARQTANHLQKLTPLFYQASLDFALNLLEINNRNEAARFEPMQLSQNAAAVQYAKTIKWDKYPYSLILIPGSGNDLPNISLSGFGKIRLKIAVDRYRKGLAPLIAVSGGYVHPFQTPFCEAIEMKKYLINVYHIPPKAILIDPHARHTTTNIRNVNRLIYNYRFPANKKALIITDENHSRYIENKDFEQRCLKEMKCLPHKNLKRISVYDLEYLPDVSSLFYYSIDPLDP